METLANGYSSESTRRELSNEYQDDRVSMVSQEFCILVLWTKVVSALEGLRLLFDQHCRNEITSLQQFIDPFLPVYELNIEYFGTES